MHKEPLQITGKLREMASENARAVISALLGTALGITITYMTGVASNRTEIVRLATQVQNLTDTIKVNMADRYRGSDAVRDFRYIQAQINEIKIHDKEFEILLREHVEKNYPNK